MGAERTKTPGFSRGVKKSPVTVTREGGVSAPDWRREVEHTRKRAGRKVKGGFCVSTWEEQNERGLKERESGKRQSWRRRKRERERKKEKPKRALKLEEKESGS